MHTPKQNTYSEFSIDNTTYRVRLVLYGIFLYFNFVSRCPDKIIIPVIFFAVIIVYFTMGYLGYDFHYFCE